MGLCWSEPPPPPAKQKSISTVQPSAPPLVYNPPFVGNPTISYNPNYTYAVRPQQQFYAQQQYPPQMYPPQQYQAMYQQYYPQQQQQRQVGTGTAFVGGMILGSVAENMLDPE